MNYKEILKNKSNISQVKPDIVNFLESNKKMHVAYNNGTEFPVLEFVEYRYFKGEHLIVLTPASIFLNIFESGTSFTGFICDGDGLKMSKKLYADFTCRQIETSEEILKELALEDMLVKKMLTHGAKFFKLNSKKAKITLSPAEIYDLDEELNPTFAKLTQAGKERFEHSRHVLMTYLDREVIFNVVVENNTYYTLTRCESNKMKHINSGGVCEIFDGKDTHFSTTIKVLDETEEVFNKLKETNNAFFKENKNLVALSFTK